ncbi:cytochrome c1 ['Osedax' symbiont bacterium Rs2_46_30_T18]|nr:cytochrome c1 ['Osedax' symbiont bacterium Rs2_46_30_T18]
MKKLLILLTMLVLPVAAMAESGGVHLDKMDVDLHNKASLQRGMTTYVNNCLGCHSMEYQRYLRTAEDLEIPADLVKDNLIFSDQKVGDLMTNTMPKGDAANWFGTAPPDLTLESRLRGPDWIYTYMRSFYQDESRPWGVNNAVFKDVGMPNVLGYLQGVQLNHCSAQEMAEHETEIDPLTGVEIGGCYSLVEGSGEQNAKEFDKTVYDLVNFMAYIGEPSKLQSQAMGTNVLIFLFIFFFFTYALKKEYWRDIH